MEVGLVAVWLVASLLLGLLATPLAAWLLPGPGHASLAFPLSLAVLGVVGHLVGQVAFGPPAAIAGVAALAGLTAFAVRARGGGAEGDRAVDDGDRTVDRLSTRLGVDRAFGEAAAVFTGAFLLVVAVRALDPAAAPLPVAIGEKLLDYGLIRSLQRAPTLPPEDVWFAGEPVRYHYVGHVVVVLLSSLTGTAGRFAYNLGLAGFYATLVTAAYGLAGAIAAPYDVSRRPAAAFGAFFVGLAGNLDTPARVLVWLLPEGAAGWVATGLGYEAEVLQWEPTKFNYFRASRVFPVDPTNPDSFMAATEFPLFAWLNGDLHAHMMSQPFMLLAAGVLLAYWRSADDPRRRARLLLGALPPVAGLVGMVNVWSFPTVGGLAVLAVTFAPGDPRDLVAGLSERGRPLVDRLGPRDHWLVEEGRRVGFGVLAGVAVLLVGLLWTLPFWLDVVLGGPGRTPAVWGRWTGLGGLLRVHGAFLAVLAVYLAGASALAAESPRLLWAGALAVFAVAVLLGLPAVGLVLPLGLGAWWLLRTRTDVGFEVLLVLAGAGLVLLVELVVVEGERFNTVFKYYAHVWLFWSVASGVALARLWSGWPAGLRDVSLPRWRTVGRGLAVAVVISASFYGAFAFPAHANDPGPAVATSGPTLDALAYLDAEAYLRDRLRTDLATEAAAIRWLDDREGRPVIVTAAPGGYFWHPSRGQGASAPASLTGLPTVLGWHHERQYRGPEAYAVRLDHVQAIYAGEPARQRALLVRYHVQYVYVGPAERETYDTITVGDLDAVTVAGQWEAVTVYRVDQSAL